MTLSLSDPEERAVLEDVALSEGQIFFPTFLGGNPKTVHPRWRYGNGYDGDGDGYGDGNGNGYGDGYGDGNGSR